MKEELLGRVRSRFQFQFWHSLLLSGVLKVDKEIVYHILLKLNLNLTKKNFRLRGKGQFISKGLFGFPNSSKKRTKTI